MRKLKLTHFQRFSILFVLVLLALPFACASVLVSISPREFEGDTITLYPDETAYYEITVFNDSAAAVPSIHLKVVCDDSLALLEGTEESTMLLREVTLLESGEKEQVYIKVKALEANAESYNIGVHYGEEQYNHFSATFLNVEESLLEINTSLEKTALGFGEKNAVKLELKNKSDFSLRNVRARIQYSAVIDSDGTELFLKELEPGARHSDREFLFSSHVRPGESGVVVLAVEFSDSLGLHKLEKRFSFEVQEKNVVIYYILGILLLLVVLSLLTKGKRAEKKPTLEEPVLKELGAEEGEKKEENSSQQ